MLIISTTSLGAIGHPLQFSTMHMHHTCTHHTISTDTVAGIIATFATSLNAAIGLVSRAASFVLFVVVDEAVGGAVVGSDRLIAP